MSEKSYRIEYSIQVSTDDEQTFTEVGFGSSGSWNAVNAALYAVSSDVQNRMWETEGDMPEPEEVDADA